MGMREKSRKVRLVHTLETQPTSFRVKRFRSSMSSSNSPERPSPRSHASVAAAMSQRRLERSRTREIILPDPPTETPQNKSSSSGACGTADLGLRDATGELKSVHEVKQTDTEGKPSSASRIVGSVMTTAFNSSTALVRSMGTMASNVVLRGSQDSKTGNSESETITIPEDARGDKNKTGGPI